MVWTNKNISFFTLNEISHYILNVLYPDDLIKISPSNLLLFSIISIISSTVQMVLPVIATTTNSKLLSFLPSINFALPGKIKQHKSCYTFLLFRMLQVHHLIINVQKIIQHFYTLQSQNLEVHLRLSVSWLCFSCQVLLSFTVSWLLTSFPSLRFLPLT